MVFLGRTILPFSLASFTRTPTIGSPTFAWVESRIVSRRMCMETSAGRVSARKSSEKTILTYTSPEMAALLEVCNLSVTFDTARGCVPAVRDVSFTLAAGEILGLVGESGSGKSATALALPRILDANARVAGRVIFEGRDLLALPEGEMRRVRGAGLSMIFQEPMTALNPVMKIGDQIAEALRAHTPMSWSEARQGALDMLRQVAIPEPETRMRQYPHHLSGGMRQRVM